MRCHEARNRIDSGSLDDAALLEHLQDCAACARLANTERQLSNALRLLAADSGATTTPLPVLRRKIEQTVAGQQRKEIPIMSSIFSQIRIHPRLSTGLALAVAVFLFVALVPFSYQRLAGYDAQVAYTNLPAMIPQASLKSALATLGVGDVKIRLEQKNDQTIFVDERIRQSTRRSPDCRCAQHAGRYEGRIQNHSEIRNRFRQSLRSSTLSVS